MAENKNSKKEIVFGPQPKLRLKLSDKIYLATALRDEDVTKYVYSLVISGVAGRYTSETSVEVTAFDDAAHAEAYFDALNDVVAVYKNHPTVRQMQPLLAPHIKIFEDMFITR